MHLFIHDILFCIQVQDNTSTSMVDYPFITDVSDAPSWEGEIVLKDVPAKVFSQLLIQFFKKELPIYFTKLTYIIDLEEQKKTLKRELKNYFSVIDAAGGIVFKEDTVLLIHRLGKWDLPKGKRDKGEKMREAAVREVTEECGVLVTLQYKIVTTWHTYMYKGKPTLKKTKWYAMQLLDDKKMAPQMEEDIEQVVWVTHDEADNLLEDTYASIQFVWEKTKGNIQSRK